MMTIIEMTICLLATMIMSLLLFFTSFLALKKARSIVRGAHDDALKAWGSPFRPIMLVLPSPASRGGGDDLHPFSGRKAPVINFNASSTATLLTFRGCCKRGPSRHINNNAIESAVFQEAGFCLPVPSPGLSTPSLTTVDFCHHSADLGASLLSACAPPCCCWTYMGGDNVSFEKGDVIGKIYPASDLQATARLLLPEAGQHDVMSRRLATVTLGGHVMCTPAVVPPTKLVVVPFIITEENDVGLEIVFGVFLLFVGGRNHADNGSGGPVAVADTPCSRSRRSASPEGIWRLQPQISYSRVCSPPPIRRVTSRSSPTSSRNRTAQFPRRGMENVAPVSSSIPLKVFPPASSQSSRVASEKYRLAQSKKRSDSATWFKRLGAIFQGQSTKRPNHTRRVVRVKLPG